MPFTLGLVTAAIANSQMAAAPPPPSFAASDPFTSLTPMTEETLGDQRGGAVIAGYEVDMGVALDIDGSVTTIVSNLETLRTALVSVGQDPDRYSDQYLSNLSDTPLVQIFQNQENNIILEHNLTIDIVVSDIQGGDAFRSAAEFNNNFVRIGSIFSSF